MEIELFWFLYEHENGILKIDRDLSPWGVRMLRIMSGENKGQLLLQVCSKLPDDCPLGNGWYVEAIGHASKVKNIEQTD
jgi:hypothetical protein